MDRKELHDLGWKLRASARGPMFDYIDGTLPLLIERVPEQKPKQTKESDADCPECAKRRQLKAAAQKRWRDKK